MLVAMNGITFLTWFEPRPRHRLSSGFSSLQFLQTYARILPESTTDYSNIIIHYLPISRRYIVAASLSKQQIQNILYVSVANVNQQMHRLTNHYIKTPLHMLR
jgi:hypothetical protein